MSGFEPTNSNLEAKSLPIVPPKPQQPQVFTTNSLLLYQSNTFCDKPHPLPVILSAQIMGKTLHICFLCVCSNELLCYILYDTICRSRGEWIYKCHIVKESFYRKLPLEFLVCTSACAFAQSCYSLYMDSL